MPAEIRGLGILGRDAGSLERAGDGEFQGIGGKAGAEFAGIVEVEPGEFVEVSAEAGGDQDGVAGNAGGSDGEGAAAGKAVGDGDLTRKGMAPGERAAGPDGEVVAENKTVLGADAERGEERAGLAGGGGERPCPALLLEGVRGVANGLELAESSISVLASMKAWPVPDW